MTITKSRWLYIVQYGTISSPCNEKYAYRYRTDDVPWVSCDVSKPNVGMVYFHGQ